MTDRELDIGMKVRLHGYEVWKVVGCALNFSQGGKMVWEIQRGCIKRYVPASSLVPYEKW